MVQRLIKSGLDEKNFDVTNERIDIIRSSFKQEIEDTERSLIMAASSRTKNKMKEFHIRELN